MNPNKLHVPPRLGMPEEWPDTKIIDKQGTTRPEPTLANTRLALHFLGLPFSHNLFNGKKLVGNMELNTDVAGQVTDDAVTALRVLVRQYFEFDPGKNNAWDAVNMFCREHPYHPIKDYLESLTWDGASRIDRMLVDYFGAPDTPFIRAVSRIVMIASVRRIYEPGCKFDYMTVLESPEGYEKSSALAALYGAEFFSDQTILGLDDKQLAETLRGRWCIECADLSGMRKAEVEKVKAQLSRFEDRTRPAYGRAVIDAPRSAVFWGTTNELEYLRSQTGNRRFFPVPVGRINVKAILRDRDQLWAEAKYANDEPLGESIMLPEPLWKAAGKEQEARTYKDAWADTLADLSRLGARHTAEHARAVASLSAGERENHPPAEYENRDGRERVTTRWLLTDLLGISAGQQNAEHGKRLGMIMRKDGWRGPKGYQIDGRWARGYERDTWEAGE
jgi:predicted P-loop ATPase